MLNLLNLLNLDLTAAEELSEIAVIIRLRNRLAYVTRNESLGSVRIRVRASSPPT
ncbi:MULTISPECIES: hypothetical protein [unclassified Microbacterium]|uniref:hypothetical protein n=1 Tax=unclassified Microbacterium TaxID=2609290 RepID=UPI0015E48612|nr:MULTISPECIES: hypothetical protein [unclassified Microbacterium]